MIRILIADDSLLTRTVIRDILDRDPELEIVGEVTDGRQAVDAARSLRPDLIIMDVMMPVLDGLDATTEIMSETPTPILILSANVDPQSSRNAFQAIRLGALDVLEKPKGLGTEAFEPLARTLLSRIHMLSRIRVMTHHRRATRPAARQSTTCLPAKATARTLLAIGASTGGPKAVMHLLNQLPQRGASILIVQHIAAGFAEGFAAWLDNDSPWKVRIACDGDRLEPGVALVAPCRQHLIIAQGRVCLTDSPPVNSCRPSVDELFHSIVRDGRGTQTTAVILTGMGNDGANGLAALKAAGACCLAQDEESCAVFGMPRVAIERDAVDMVLPLTDMPHLIAEILAPKG
jgi:two-component system chemotaxis response regulator CheB